MYITEIDLTGHRECVECNLGTYRFKKSSKINKISKRTIFYVIRTWDSCTQPQIVTLLVWTILVDPGLAPCWAIACVQGVPHLRSTPSGALSPGSIGVVPTKIDLYPVLIRVWQCPGHLECPEWPYKAFEGNPVTPSVTTVTKSEKSKFL